jgi:repressor LexA
MTKDIEQLRQLREQVEQQLDAAGEFGQHVRQARRRKKMTLDHLTAATGISKAYLSQIENGRVDPPRDEKVHRLEKALGQQPGTLIELAHLAQAPEDVRRRLESLRNAFERSEQALQTLLRKLPDDGAAAGTATPLPRERPLHGRVPIINRVAAGPPSEFTDMDYPPGVADDYLSTPPGLADPHAFAVAIEGDSMVPHYREGDIVLFSPAAPVTSGDDCYVRFAAECRTAQGATFKRIYFDSDTAARLQPLNDQYPPWVVPLEEISGIYRAVYRYEAL